MGTCARLAWTVLASLFASMIALTTSCGERETLRVTPGETVDRDVLARYKTKATERATRRAYDGAPPTIPHAPFAVACTSCHNELGMQVPDLGFAPPMPHEATKGLSAISRCDQCHVYRKDATLFRATSFVGRPQDLAKGSRQHEGAPPVLPHPVFMRENCLACHSGPAAREELRCSHPERSRCVQCHLESVTSTSTSFTR